MKISFHTLIFVILMSLFAISCRTSEDPIEPKNSTENLVKIKDITNDTHIIELYSATGTTTLGYNDLKLRIKNKSTNQYENNATISWTPLMHMTMMTHSCPKSTVSKLENNLYGGYIVFQMPQNDTEYWDLKIDYIVNGVSYTATSVIDVPVSSKQKVSSFMGTDNVRYVVAMIDPKSPKVAVNDMTVGVWKMQDMMTFSVVDGYTVKIDPRMPGMGNHTSPNNVHPTQILAGQMYKGKLSLTMTGYWKINLQLIKADGTVVKGEPITDAVQASSIYFELEF